MEENISEDLILNNKECILRDYGIMIKLIKDNINKQLKLISLYTKVSCYERYAKKDKFAAMSFTVLYKNCFTIYSILELTTLGLYGSARTLFRNIFEYQIIAKSVAILNDTTILDKWENGDRISLNELIFKKIKKPQSSSMIELWDTFNKYTHGTIYSQQIIFDYGEIKNEIEFNLSCIFILLVTNYHIVNSYIANRSLKYYCSRYYMGEEEFKELNEILRKQSHVIKKSIPKRPNEVIHDFCSKWIFK